MSYRQLKKWLCIIVAIIFAFLALIFFGGIMGYRGRVSTVQLSSPKGSTGILAKGTILQQRFDVPEETLNSFCISIYEGTDPFFSYTFSQNNQNIAQGTISKAKDTMHVELLGAPVAVETDMPVSLTIEVLEGNNVAFAYGSTHQLTRGEVAISDLNADNCLIIDDREIYGKLSAEMFCTTYINAGLQFFIFSTILMSLSVSYVVWVLGKERRGEHPLISRVIYAFKNYWFLMRQMISRDFKTKYKRSVLGIFWSFLNPLLMMGMQYLVFSTLFQSSIPYFPVYLMIGIICFTFFNEGTNVGLSSITGNVALLSKVYIPKYIFPISRVISSGINFLFSMIPLFIIVAISGLPLTRAYMLLPFAMLCLLMLIIGVALLLGTMMVFFRDIQFLWSVITSLLMYVTPIFYPESILSDKLLIIAKLNPLYHIIRFMRSAIIDGASPEPKAYLLCIIACGVPLIIGVLVFKHNQDKFMLKL